MNAAASVSVDVTAVAADERDRSGDGRRGPASRLAEHERARPAPRPAVAALGVRAQRVREVGEVVLPLHAAVGPDPGVEEHAARRGLRATRRARTPSARSTSSRGRPSRSARRRTPAAARRPRFGSMPGVMSMMTSSRTRSGRDAATAAAVSPPRDCPTSELRAVRPRRHPGDDVWGERRARYVGVVAPRRIAVAGQVDREGVGEARARGSWCPTCGRSGPRRAGGSSAGVRRPTGAHSACGRPEADERDSRRGGEGP